MKVIREVKVPLTLYIRMFDGETLDEAKKRIGDMLEANDFEYLSTDMDRAIILAEDI